MGKENATFQITFKTWTESQKEIKTDLKKNLGFFFSHVSVSSSKYHHGRNQFAAAVDSPQALNSLIVEVF